MKTYILQLESYDDCVSTQDKMGWSKAARILLVWPKRGKILRNKIDLVLIQRKSASLGAQLALVCRDPQVVEIAKELGIPIYRSALQAQRATWRRPRFRKRFSLRPPAGQKTLAAVHALLPLNFTDSKRRSASGLIAFIAGVLAVLTLVAFFLPSAQITVFPEQKDQTLTLKVWASPDIPEPNVSGGLPARKINIVVEGQDAATSTGRITLPARYAFGSVTFSNLTDQPVDIPVGTVVLSISKPPIRFATLDPISISAGVGKQTEARIKAILPGTSGNAIANSIQAVEGAVGSSVGVNNLQPLAGGGDDFSPAVTTQDFAALRERLLTSLRDNAINGFAQMLSENEEAVPATLTTETILSEVREPEAGQPADQLHLTLRVEFSILAYSRQDLNAVAAAALNAGLTKNFAGLDTSLNVVQVTQPAVAADGLLRWEILAQRQIQAVWNSNQIIQALIGKRVDSVTLSLDTLVQSRSNPVVELFPSWWLRLPFLPFQYTVRAQ